MSKPFEHYDILPAELFNEHTSSLKIQSESAPKIALLRGIIGSSRIKHQFTKIEFDQTIDFLDLEKKNTAKQPIERLKDYIAPELTIEEFCQYFSNKKFLFGNFGFFERLNNEYSNFYYHTVRNSHTTAFIYIYRILETISYSFPLIYASKAEDFKGTYSFLKDCFSSNKGDKDKGELGFFKSFVRIVFKDDPMFENSLRVDIAAETTEAQQLIFNSFKKACPEDIFDSNDTLEPERIAIKFSEYSSFIINLRNRFFHLFNSGQSNLESNEIYDSDHFFSLTNNQSINWLSIILVEIFKFSIEKGGDE